MSVTCAPAMRPLGGFANFTSDALATITTTSVRTARRWKREGLAPRWVIRLLNVLLRGELAEISPAWDGWTLREGKLYSPEGSAFTPNEIRALPLRLQEMREHERAAKRAIEPPPPDLEPVRRLLRSLETELSRLDSAPPCEPPYERKARDCVDPHGRQSRALDSDRLNRRG